MRQDIAQLSAIDISGEKAAHGGGVLRGVTLGRKNWTFAGSDAGGERAAAIFTIIETAKLNGIDPEAYLREVLARIAEGYPINRIGELMPWGTKLPPRTPAPDALVQQRAGINNAAVVVPTGG